MMTLFLLSLSLLSSCASSTVEEPSDIADRLIHSMGSNDWQEVAEAVHSDLGLQFSPYAYIDSSSDVVLSRAEVARFSSDTSRRLWGLYDGSGDSIFGSGSQYGERFIHADVHQKSTGEEGCHSCGGNSLNNVNEFYGANVDTNVRCFEYCYHGSEKMDGMDWHTLRLVLRFVEKRWWLVGVIHDEWTI